MDNGTVAIADPTLIQMCLFDIQADEPEEEEIGKIEIILLCGSGFEGGKKRICDFGYTNPTTPDFAKMLKDEYGTGGFSSRVEGIHFTQYDNGGIKCRWDSETGEEVKTTITWVKAAEVIKALIEQGRYQF